VPKWGHSLHYLLSHTLDETVLTLLASNLNTHDLHWSRSNQTPSSWGCALTNWANIQGLTCLNPTDTLTWFHLTTKDRASTINLAFANEATLFTGQLSDLTATGSPVPLLDHAALSLPFYSLTSLTLIPPSTPKEYSADPKQREEWTKAFLLAFNASNSIPHHSDQEVNPCSQRVESEHSDHDTLSQLPTATLDLNNAL